MASETRAVFYFDLGSPYAWLAAERVDELLHFLRIVTLKKAAGDEKNGMGKFAADPLGAANDNVNAFDFPDVGHARNDVRCARPFRASERVDAGSGRQLLKINPVIDDRNFVRSDMFLIHAKLFYLFGNGQDAVRKTIYKAVGKLVFRLAQDPHITAR